LTWNGLKRLATIHGKLFYESVFIEDCFLKNNDMLNSLRIRFYGLTRKFGALRPVSWIGARFMHHIDRIVYKLTGSRHTAVNLLFGVPVISVTTIGAKSGRPRSVPLVGVPDGENFILIASNWGQERHPGWYYNMRKTPLIKISLNGSEGDFVAREVTGEERAGYWDKAAAVYGGYNAYERRVEGRQIPVILLTPQKDN
jgi:deazaflavin-dependent oxidoreductase (nitroreductase family)